MSYNSSKGPQITDDLKYRDDATDTQIDFEKDFIALKTNGAQRLIVSSSAVTSSVVFSGSGEVSAGHFLGDAATMGILTASQVEVSGSDQSLIKLHTKDSDTLKEIVFLKSGIAAAAIQINSAEHLFIENENTKDIILRTNNQNALRVIGSQRRVIVGNVSRTTATAQLDVEGNAAITGSLETTQAITGSGLRNNGPLQIDYTYKGEGNYKDTPYSVKRDDHLVIFDVVTNDPPTASLPTLGTAIDGIMYRIKNLGSKECHITGATGQDNLIDLALDLKLEQGSSIGIVAIDKQTGGGADWNWITVNSGSA